jgi:hypothetical protein
LGGKEVTLFIFITLGFTNKLVRASLTILGLVINFLSLANWATLSLVQATRLFNLAGALPGSQTKSSSSGNEVIFGHIVVVP